MEDSSDDSYTKKHKRKRKSRDRERKSKKKKKSDRRKRRKKEKDDYDSSSPSRRSDDSSSYDRYKKRKRKRNRCEEDEKYKLEKRLKSRVEEQSSPSLVDKEIEHTRFQQDTSTPSATITTNVEDKSDSKPDKRSMAPMTKEEYEKQQNTIREVYDPQSGRYRLVKGTGEIIERIVSRNDHQRINRIATRNDGLSFSMNITNEASKRNPFSG